MKKRDIKASGVTLLPKQKKAKNKVTPDTQISSLNYEFIKTLASLYKSTESVYDYAEASMQKLSEGISQKKHI